MNESPSNPVPVTAGLHYTVETGVKPGTRPFGPNNIPAGSRASMKCGR